MSLASCPAESYQFDLRVDPDQDRSEAELRKRKQQLINILENM
jgi:ATP-dependent DNA ligase